MVGLLAHSLLYRDFDVALYFVFLRVTFQGSTIRTASVKDARDSSRDLSLARSGHCSVITKFDHLHAFLSLVN